jgi:hypothetical protein
MKSLRTSMIGEAKRHRHQLEPIIIEMGTTNKIIDVTEVAYAIGGDTLTKSPAHAKIARAYRIVAAHLLQRMSDGERLVQHGVWEHPILLEKGGPYFTLPVRSNEDALAVQTKGETMKLEIEITEEELRSAIERKVRTAVSDQTNNYGTDAYIKEQVKAHWKAAVDALVAEALNDSKTLREKIAAELEKKLRAQLAAALKNAA